MVHRRFFVGEIQRRIVLKFQIFRIISFEDIIVGSWSGLNLNSSKKVKITKNLQFFRCHKYLSKLSAAIIIIMPLAAEAGRQRQKIGIYVVLKSPAKR